MALLRNSTRRKPKGRRALQVSEVPELASCPKKKKLDMLLKGYQSFQVTRECWILVRNIPVVYTQRLIWSRGYQTFQAMPQWLLRMVPW
ncbi:unnamed protein product [Sphagnum troendelagicum]